MEEFKVGQLTKEMVVTRLKALGDPCAAAADVAKKTLVIALKSIGPSPGTGAGRVVGEVCYGAMVGLLLTEQNLPKGATLILEKVAEAASELNLDPTEALTWALRGIADTRKLLDLGQVREIAEAIKRAFDGAGEAFMAMIEEDEAKTRPAGG